MHRPIHQFVTLNSLNSSGHKPLTWTSHTMEINVFPTELSDSETWWCLGSQKVYCLMLKTSFLSILFQASYVHVFAASLTWLNTVFIYSTVNVTYTPPTSGYVWHIWKINLPKQNKMNDLYKYIVYFSCRSLSTGASATTHNASVHIHISPLAQSVNAVSVTQCKLVVYTYKERLGPYYMPSRIS